MTTVDFVIAAPGTAVARGLVSITGREARRLAGHPVLWLVPAIVVPAIVVPATGADAVNAGRTAGYWYNIIFSVVAFLGPMIVFFAANLVASAARRSRAEEMLAVAPTTDRRRTLAMCLGVTLALAGSGVAGATTMALIDSKVGNIPPEDLLTSGELAQIPFILAGAGLLGVLAGRWLHFAGGALITFVAFVLGAVTLFSRLDTGTWWMWWSTSTTLGDRPSVAGDPWLHAAYLAGLCACATVAAVYRDRTQWTRLALVGVPVLAVTLALGWLQLP